MRTLSVQRTAIHGAAVPTVVYGWLLYLTWKHSDILLCRKLEWFSFMQGHAHQASIPVPRTKVRAPQRMERDANLSPLLIPERLLCS